MPEAAVVHRTTQSPAWWLFGAGLAAAAWWGQPLLTGGMTHNFYGVFWYTMIAAGAFFWALPTEHRCESGRLSRSHCLLGLLPVWQQVRPASDFREVALEQEPNVFGRDSVWVMLRGAEGEPRFAFAQFRATERGIAAAQLLAQRLVTASGLPLAQD